MFLLCIIFFINHNSKLFPKEEIFENFQQLLVNVEKNKILINHHSEDFDEEISVSSSSESSSSTSESFDEETSSALAFISEKNFESK